MVHGVLESERERRGDVKESIAARNDVKTRHCLCFLLQETKTTKTLETNEQITEGVTRQHKEGEKRERL